jgi:hypothetical protein
METFNVDAVERGDAKDAYNEAAVEDWSDFNEQFEVSLAILDGLDGTCGNQLYWDDTAGIAYARLAAVLTDDQLYVNSDEGVCGTYLGVEAEVLGVVEPGEGDCGGRTPLDDVIDRSYSALAAGLLTGVDDTITSDDETHSNTDFPFLAAPQD